MTPKLSLAIPYHDRPNGAYYLARLLQSIAQQSFTDYEIVITKEGNFARNHNAAIQKSKGEYVQMLQSDDYLPYSDSLKKIVQGLEDSQRDWQITGCLHHINGFVGNPHSPTWTEDIWTGNNRLGSVSTLSFKRESALFFEEPLTWVVDVDLYYRLYLKYGLPNLLHTANVIINTSDDRLSSTLSDALKAEEISYLRKKYGN